MFTCRLFGCWTAVLLLIVSGISQPSSTFPMFTTETLAIMMQGSTTKAATMTRNARSMESILATTQSTSNDASAHSATVISSITDTTTSNLPESPAKRHTTANPPTVATSLIFTKRLQTSIRVVPTAVDMAPTPYPTTSVTPTTTTSSEPLLASMQATPTHATAARTSSTFATEETISKTTYTAQYPSTLLVTRNLSSTMVFRTSATPLVSATSQNATSGSAPPSVVSLYKSSTRRIKSSTSGIVVVNTAPVVPTMNASPSTNQTPAFQGSSYRSEVATSSTLDVREIPSSLTTVTDTLRHQQTLSGTTARHLDTALASTTRATITATTQQPILVSPTRVIHSESVPLLTTHTPSASPTVRQRGGGSTNLIPVIAGAGVGIVIIMIVIAILLCKRYFGSKSDKETSTLLKVFRSIDTDERGRGVTNIAMVEFGDGVADDPDEYTVVYQFEGTNDDEVDFEPQDTVQVLEKNDSGWWRGTVSKNGRTGWFPAEYVEKKKSSFQRRNTVTIVATPRDATTLAAAEQRQQAGLEETITCQLETFPTAVKAKLTAGPQSLSLVGEAMVNSNNLNPFSSAMEHSSSVAKCQQTTPSQITTNNEQSKTSVEPEPLKATTESLVIAALDRRLVGESSSKTEVLQPSSIAATTDTPETVNTGNTSTVSTHEALYDYKALREDELSLGFGDCITVLEQGDDGWWRGTNSGGQTGWFPYNYVSVVEPIGQSNQTGLELSLDTSESGVSSMAEEEEGTEYRAIYPYIAQRDDEVSLNEGEVVLVFETADSGWWRGSVGHSDGWFPGNYVEPIITEDIAEGDMSSSRPPSMVLDWVKVSDEKHLSNISNEQEKRPPDERKREPTVGFLAELAGSLQMVSKKEEEEVERKEPNDIVTEISSLSNKQSTIASQKKERPPILKEKPRPRSEKPLSTVKQAQQAEMVVPPFTALDTVQLKQPSADLNSKNLTNVVPSHVTTTEDSLRSTADAANSAFILDDPTPVTVQPTESVLSQIGSNKSSVQNALPSRPFLPKRTVKSKLVKLPQGGAVKKRTQAVTVRPPPPNRALPPPPPARELSPSPQINQQQVAAAKETIGMRKKQPPLPPVFAKRRKPPSGEKPRLPTRWRPSPSNGALENKQKSPRPPQPAAEVDVAKPANSPSETVQSVSSIGMSSKLDRVDEEVPRDKSDKVKVSVNKPALHSETVPRDRKPLPASRASEEEKLSLSPLVASPDLKPVASQKPSVSPKPGKPPLASKPVIAEKPNVVSKLQDSTHSLSEATKAVMGNRASGSVITQAATTRAKVLQKEEKEEESSTLKLRPPPPSATVPPPPSSSNVPSLQENAEMESQPDKHVRPDKRKRIKPVKPSDPSKNENVANSKVIMPAKESKTPINHKPETTPDTDISRSLLKKNVQPTVLFVASGQDATAGMLKPLPKTNKADKTERRINHEEIPSRSSAKSVLDDKPKTAPPRPKRPSTQPMTSPSEVVGNQNGGLSKPKQEKRTDAVRPQPAPRRKEAMDDATVHPKPQPRPRPKSRDVEEIAPVVPTQKVKPARPMKGPVIDSSNKNVAATRTPPPSRPPPPTQSAVEKNSAKPAKKATPSDGSGLAVSADKMKPARPSAPPSQSDLKRKPARPPPPKSDEKSKVKSNRPQPQKRATSNPLRKAIATYHAQRLDELTFNEGDLIVEVKSVDEHGWCKGKVITSGKEGMYPGNFVEPA